MSAMYSSGSPTSRSPEKDWLVREEPFEVEESEFVCDGEQEPLQSERSTELAVQGWNLKKTILELNSQICNARDELKTQKNLTKNLQRIVVSVQGENSVRAKDNHSLKATVAQLEKRIEELNALNINLNNNLTRQKKIAGSLQARLTETEKSLIGKLKESNAALAQCRLDLSQLEATATAEKTKLETDNDNLTQERERLQAVVASLTEKIHEVEGDSFRLQTELIKSKEQCEDAARFLNHELERAYENMHSKLEKALGRKDEYQMKLMEFDHERDQMLAFMLSEGLQLPRLAPFNVAQAREKIRQENLHLDS